MGCFGFFTLLVKRALFPHCGECQCSQFKLFTHKECHKLENKIYISEHQKSKIIEDRNTEVQIISVSGDETIPDVGTRDFPGSSDFTDRPVPAEDTNKQLDVLEPILQPRYSFSDFKVDSVIGQGSYAKVCVAELKETKQIYAMKIIKKALVTNADRIQTEKRIFEIAVNCPFLVGLHSCFQTPSKLYFVIEFACGGDFVTLMQREAILLEQHARFYAAEISVALNFLHSNGIIHRDLKLDNVLLDHEGHIKLTDYGLCKEGIKPGHTTSTFCGTPSYFAPEMLLGHEYGFSVDWWALGVLLYEMINGTSPFNFYESSTDSNQDEDVNLFVAILDEDPIIPETLSENAANVINDFLKKNPRQRLGCYGLDPFSEITSHEFFENIDWDLLKQKKLLPPFKPQLNSDRDLANFPSEFTAKPVSLTPDNRSDIEGIDQSEFEGFEYINSALMLLEDCV